LGDWRTHERLRTTGALLVLCLNLGTSPPDLEQPEVSAVLEAWVDPTVPRTPMKMICENLARQYEHINRHTKYKPLPDCAMEDLRKYCVQFRRSVKEERLLFHYNGHGVPRPTASGDIWVFNKQFTQYIPLNAVTLMSWIGTPCVYVWDCSHAMSVVQAFEKNAKLRDHGAAAINPGMINLALLPSMYHEDIHFAATRAGELLPTNPELPADLFTSCLTTPVKAAIRFWVIRNPHTSKITLDQCEKLPGQVHERRTPVGELNWIFTSITDTIAWNTLPRDLFRKLFRQDVLVASLYRNFMLADRIMRFYGVHPQSSPAIPPTHKHPLWDSLDLEIDMCLAQLPRADGQQTGYISSTYFSNQLFAFEVWLQHTATTPPDELPAVLQVLLSQQYRMRALILLYRFMNLGPWAVDLAMAVGIYPYMSKLLASATTEIGEILILVWTRLVAIDRGVHPDLMKPEGLKHFVDYLSNNIQMQHEPISEKVLLCDTVSAASAFTLTMLCRGVSAAQQACFNERVLDYFLVYLQRPDNGTEERARLRTWVLMCLAELWRGYPNAKWMALTVDEQNAQNLLIPMAFHRSPVVRAAAIYAMGTLLEDLTQLGYDPGVVALLRKAERQLYALLLQAATDGSPMVRREVARVIGSAVFATYMPQTMKAVARAVGEEIREPRRPLRTHGANAEEASEPLLPEVPLDLLLKLYKTLLELSVDVHPDVSLLAREACDVLMQTYAHSRAFFDAEPSLDQALHRLEITRSSSGQQPILEFIRSAGTGIGDALLGFPPPSHGGSPVSQGGSMHNQSLQHRRVALPRSRNSAGLQQQQQQPRSRDAMAQNSSSTLLDWAGAYFTEFDISLFANVNGPLQGSLALVESRERNRRVERMETSARTMGTQAGSMKWMDVRAVASNRDPASVALLHPLEPHAIVASRKGTVSVYDWELAAQVGHYSIGPQGSYGEASSISSLHLINPLGHSKLLVGTRDGKVRIFASHSSTPPPLSASDTSFIFAGARIYGEPEGCGLVTAWNQRSNVLFAGGNDKEVRVWDVSTEMCIEEIPVVSMGGITCVSHDGVSGNIFAVGNANGLVRVMDRRLDARSGAVASWREHSPDAIRNVTMRPGQTEVISAGSNGNIKYWDLRHRESVFTLVDTHINLPLEHMIAHENAPVILTSSDATVKLWNQRGNNIGLI
ncbi:hypothetical protein COEREDRAFT_20747, partial [Coemansia reversa NRRL 1564]